MRRRRRAYVARWLRSFSHTALLRGFVLDLARVRERGLRDDLVVPVELDRVCP